MRAIIITFLLSQLSLLSFGQNIISGTVLDSVSRTPLERASVYINGTTKGTYTDSIGEFRLDGIVLPCQLVISYLGYNTQVTLLRILPPGKIVIYLKEKENQLKEVVTSGKSNRKQNIEEFRKIFLGDNYWGKNVQLKNDNVLVFERKTDTVMRKSTIHDFECQRKYNTLGQNSYWSADSSAIISPVQGVFTVKSKAPLIMDMPLLGYTVYVDLIKCSQFPIGSAKIISYLVYNRFSRYSPTTPTQEAKFENNRKMAYYNSSQHFFKSLVDNKLTNNGFLVLEYQFDSITNSRERQLFDIYPYVKRSDNGTFVITGLKGRKFYILYQSKFNGHPKDLTTATSRNTYKQSISGSFLPDKLSTIVFTSDTCVIRSNGTTFDNSVLRDGAFTQKRGGTFLPDDYSPGL